MSESELSLEEFEKVRLAARQAANELQETCERENNPFGWFEPLYRRAEREPAAVPWANAAPRFKLREWLAENPGRGRRALDVGCGLGDNANCLAEAGWQVTAFDISQTAVEWARGQSDNSRISFEVADLFDPPELWVGGFDLVHETYNLQAMPRGFIADAMAMLARLVDHNGTVLIITRARNESDIPEGPPWPLAKSEIERIEHCGLELVRFDEFLDEKDQPIRHFLAEYKRA